MSILSDIKELESLDIEIKSLASRLKQLRQKKSTIEESITEYLESNNHPGVKYQGKAFVTDKKSKIKRKTKSEREADMVDTLSRHVNNPEQVYRDILESMKGYETEKTVLKVKKIK